MIPETTYEQIWGLFFQTLFLLATITIAGILMMLFIKLLPFKLPNEIVNLLLLAAILISGYYWFVWFT